MSSCGVDRVEQAQSQANRIIQPPRAAVSPGETKVASPLPAGRIHLYTSYTAKGRRFWSVGKLARQIPTLGNVPPISFTECVRLERSNWPRSPVLQANMLRY